MQRTTEIALALATACVLAVDARAQDTSDPEAAGATAESAADRGRLAFTPNRGQWPHELLYKARLPATDLMFRATGVTYAFWHDDVFAEAERADAPSDRAERRDPTRRRTSARLSMRFTGPTRRPLLAASEPQRGVSHFYLGTDRDRWRTNVPSFGRVRYQGLYEGVDVAYYAAAAGLEYDFVVAPGADPEPIGFRYDGAEHVSVDEGGALVVRTPLGVLKEQAPFAYQEVDGERVQVDAKFVVDAGGQVSFALGPYDRTRELVIDPVLHYSSYLGGSGNDIGLDACARGPAGSALATGATWSANMPSQSGNAGGSDVFVARFDTNLSGTASLPWTAYFGGSGDEQGNAVVRDAAGNVYVAGHTTSPALPTVNQVPNQTSTATTQSAFAAKFDPQGVLVYLTYIGGNGADAAYGIGVTETGEAIVGGFTTSNDLSTTTGAHAVTAPGGPADCFVARIAAAGSSLVACTYFGGTNSDQITDVEVMPWGETYVCGYTSSTDLYTSACAYDKTYNGGDRDAFVAVFDGALANVRLSTYIGGGGLDKAEGLAVGRDLRVTVGGFTDSANFPVSGGGQSYIGGVQDAWLARLSMCGAKLTYSTHFGGTASDRILDVGTDGYDTYVTGDTYSNDIATVNALPATAYSANTDAFVAGFDNAGTVFFASYLPGPGFEDGRGVDASHGPRGELYVVGRTWGASFPTTPNAYDPNGMTQMEAFFLRIKNL